MREYFKHSIGDAYKALNVTEKGLSTEETAQRRLEYGYNELEEAVRKTPLQVFFEQFKDFLVFILLAAAALSAFLGKLESTLVILAVVTINAILGTIQHLKAEQSLKSLKELSSPTAKVLRDGNKIEIPSREIVVGDILYLDAGDYISADGRIIETYSLRVNESSLTGESVSVLKQAETIEGEDIPLGDRKNMVFSGSFVTYGRAVVLVTAIGMKTEIGRIANLLESADEKKTPLQASLEIFGRKLAMVIMAISAFIFIMDIVRGRSILESVMFAVALAVAAIPEALSSIVTIVLALGTQKMAKENAIVRKLHAVESLGSISVICSDKTGTLTQNRMTVQKVFIDDKAVNYDNLDHNTPLEKKLMLMALLCNDAITFEKNEIGDPTEVALVNLGEIYGLDELIIRKKYPRLGEIPFDSVRKLMSTVHRVGNKHICVTKGALDVLLSRSERIERSNGVMPLGDEQKKAIERINRTFSESGLRVLAFAYKEIPADQTIGIEDEYNLTFVGLIAMMDPPREESPKAVSDCIRAGILPVMITGDHRITASAIAKQVGILKKDEEAIEGAALEAMSDQALKDRVRDISVYARVSPEHKIRIVKAWQDLGHVVAMTGDGVNDAPALKQADIGVAMGITGTEVAKDASSMVLTDDNFSTIIKAIANGRSIYANIKNAIKFLLAGNTAGILSVFYASISALPIPFVPIHLLFINLLTDSLPAIAIGLEPHNPDVMLDKPRDIRVPLLNRPFAVEVLLEGFLIALGTMTAFHIGLGTGHGTASTMAFAVLCLSRLLHGLNSRSDASLFRVGLLSNKMIWIAILSGYLLLMAVMTIPPLMGVFEITPLNADQYLYVYILSFIPLVVVQTFKGIRDRRKGRA